MGRHPPTSRGGVTPEDDDFTVRNPMVYDRPHPKERPEFSSHAAALFIRAGPDRFVPFTMSYNKALHPLGHERASHLAGSVVVTYRVNEEHHMEVTTYDPEAPVFFEFNEVGAALSKKEGHPILFQDSPREGEGKD
jgi:hypothetical protein